MIAFDELLHPRGGALVDVYNTRIVIQNTSAISRNNVFRACPDIAEQLRVMCRLWQDKGKYSLHAINSILFGEGKKIPLKAHKLIDASSSYFTSLMPRSLEH